MNFFETPINQPEAVFLNSSDYFKPFIINLTSPDMNITESDITEIVWQILLKFDSIHEHVIEAKLNSLPDFQSLICKHILSDWRKEQKLKNAIVEFGMHLFREAKSLGLINYTMTEEYEFPYYLAKIVSGRIILKYLSGN